MPENSTEQPAQAREVFDVNIDDLDVHPGHEGIPDMGEEKFKGLVESIKEEGIRQPVELLSEEEAEARNEPGHAEKLLDGRQRVRAAKEAGLESVPAIYASIPESVRTTEYIHKQAGERRDLSKSQRAILAVRLKKELEKEVGQGARTELREKFPEDTTGRSRDRAGNVYGVSGRYVTSAEKLVDNATELAEAVRQGQMSLNQAVIEYNREEGETSEPSRLDNSRTAFKRLKSVFSKVRPSDALPKEQYEEAREHLERLEELLTSEESG